MPYDVNADLENGFVHLVYTGDVDLDQRIKARDLVFKVRRQHGLSRSLVETQDSNMNMSTLDIIQFAKTFPTNLPALYHVAVVAGLDDDVDTLIENLASTEGLAIRAFKDRDAALKWLLAF